MTVHRLTVDAVLVRDAAELVDSLDRAGHDPDSRRVVSQLKEMGVRYSELARHLKLVALQFDGRIEHEQPLRIGQVLAARQEEQQAAREAIGDGA